MNEPNLTRRWTRCYCDLPEILFKRPHSERYARLTMNKDQCSQLAVFKSALWWVLSKIEGKDQVLSTRLLLNSKSKLTRSNGDDEINSH